MSNNLSKYTASYTRKEQFFHTHLFMFYAYIHTTTFVCMYIPTRMHFTHPCIRSSVGPTKYRHWLSWHTAECAGVQVLPSSSGIDSSIASLVCSPRRFGNVRDWVAGLEKWRFWSGEIAFVDGSSEAHGRSLGVSKALEWTGVWCESACCCWVRTLNWTNRQPIE
jgi:hypothetical protein